MLPRRAQTPIGFLLALCYVCAAAARTGPELTLGSDIGASVNIQTGLSDAASTAGCDEVVVGAGWAGVYFAYRRAMANPQIASKLCVVERSERVGGRTLSVRMQGTPFVVDVGAYRFAPDMHLPGDLIMRELALPTACYEPHCPDPHVDFHAPMQFNYTQPLRRIVDAETRLPAGYATAIETMVERMKKLGVRVLLGAALIDIKPGRENSTLSFQGDDGKTFDVVATTTMLNLPRNRLLALPSVAAAVDARTLGMLQCVSFEVPASLAANMSNFEHLEPSSALTKAYLYYSDAWWLTKLNRTVGTFPSSPFTPLSTSLGIYVGVHWNDGPVVCAHGGRSQCHGYLEVYYSVTNETFFAGVSADAEHPLGELNRTQGAAAAAALDRAHAALMEALAPILAGTKFDAGSFKSPEQLLVGVWRRPNTRHPFGQGFTAPTKVYWSPEVSGSIAKACKVDGLTENEYRSRVLQPFNGAKVFLANNDWVAQDTAYMFGDWAEETLLQAERALLRLSVPAPAWLNATYYAQKVKAKE